jgi:FAD/FMN-containing dehydrogenase
MVYSRTHPSYVDMIKLLKKQLDPKGILNPDQLLEGV